MKNFFYFGLISLFFFIILFQSGCSSKNVDKDKENTTEEITSDPFEDQNTQVLGSLGHGFANPKLDEKGNRLPLSYNGGELKIDYFVRASGTARNIGFLVFIDGIPQPYKFNTTSAPYEYMHILDLEEDNKDTPFSFVFTPITGKKDETLNICIASVYNPAFIPDMKETSSYGGFHTTLEVNNLLDFHSDPSPMLSIPKYQYLSNVQQTTESVTSAFLETISSDLEQLNTQVFSKLYFDNVDIGYNSNLQVNENGILHLTFKLVGHPGVRYQNTFYINHHALTSEDGITFETLLTKGNVSVISADIDLEKLKNFNTLYVVSVPCNASDFPDDVVILLKTSSILLYKDAQINSNHSDDSTIPGSSDINNISPDKHTDSSSFAVPNTVSNLNIENLQGKIKNVYYADNGKILISSDKLYLYDIKAGKVSAESPKDTFVDENYWAIKSGYAVIGKLSDRNITEDDGFTTSNRTIKYKCIFYDRDLNKISDFNFNSLLDNDESIFNLSNGVSFSTDGNKVTYATRSGMYVYDFNKGKKSTILDFTSNDVTACHGIATVDQISFTNNNKSIAYKADSFDIPPIDGKPSFDTCGIVNIDGSGLLNQKFDNYNPKELIAYDKFLLFAEDIKTASGRLLIMNVSNGTTKIQSLTERVESGIIYGSDKGAYYATATLGKNSNWIVRIYQTQTAELETELSLPQEKESLYLANNPVIKIIDATKTLIVILGSKQSDIETKIQFYQF